MAVAFIQSTNANPYNYSSSPAVLTLPNPPTAGNYLVIFVALFDGASNATVTTPTGFIETAFQHGSTTGINLYTKVSDGTEQNVDVIFDSINNGMLSMSYSEYSGQDNSSPIEYTSQVFTPMSTSASQESPLLMPTVAGSIIISSFDSWDASNAENINTPAFDTGWNDFGPNAAPAQEVADTAYRVATVDSSDITNGVQVNCSISNPGGPVEWTIFMAAIKAAGPATDVSLSTTLPTFSDSVSATIMLPPMIHSSLSVDLHHNNFDSLQSQVIRNPHVEYVQSVSTAHSTTLTLNNPPVSGNLLFLGIGITGGENVNDFSFPSGFEYVVYPFVSNSTHVGNAVLFKISDGTEQTINFTGGLSGYKASYAEFSGEYPYVTIDIGAGIRAAINYSTDSSTPNDLYNQNLTNYTQHGMWLVYFDVWDATGSATPVTPEFITDYTPASGDTGLTSMGPNAGSANEIFSSAWAPSDAPSNQDFFSSDLKIQNAGGTTNWAVTNVMIDDPAEPGPVYNTYNINIQDTLPTFSDTVSISVQLSSYQFSGFLNNNLFKCPILPPISNLQQMNAGTESYADNLIGYDFLIYNGSETNHNDISGFTSPSTTFGAFTWSPSISSYSTLALRQDSTQSIHWPVLNVFNSKLGIAWLETHETGILHLNYAEAPVTKTPVLANTPGSNQIYIYPFIPKTITGTHTENIPFDSIKVVDFAGKIFPINTYLNSYGLGYNVETPDQVQAVRFLQTFRQNSQTLVIKLTTAPTMTQSTGLIAPQPLSFCPITIYQGTSNLVFTKLKTALDGTVSVQIPKGIYSFEIQTLNDSVLWQQTLL